MKACVPSAPSPASAADAHPRRCERGGLVVRVVRSCCRTRGSEPVPALLGPPLLPSHLSGRRDWGIENFISPTLLRNMRGKDIKKAISYHMKRNQLLLDPRQKVACVPAPEVPPRTAQHLSPPPWVFSLFPWGFSPLFSSCPLCCARTPGPLCSVFCCGSLWGCQVANAVLWAGPAPRCCLSRPSYMCWSNTMSCMKRTYSSLQVTWQTLFVCRVSKWYFFSCKTKHTLAAVQVRLSYLQILGDLKMYNGRIFNATLMVQVLFICVFGFWRTVLFLALCISYSSVLGQKLQRRVTRRSFNPCSSCAKSCLNQSRPYLKQKCLNIFLNWLLV